jgi:hypothetical protein
MTSDFITPNDLRWENSLNRIPHDFYQTPGYLSFSGNFEGGEPLAFWAEQAGEVFCSLC